MKTLNVRFSPFLQLFADGGEGNAAESSNTGATETVAASQSGEKDLPIRYLDEEKEQRTAPDAGETQQEAPDIDAEFKSLIKKGGKYHDVYQKNFQKAIDGRFKANAEQEAMYNKSKEVMQKLAAAYGKSPDDYEGISNALDADENLFADAAIEAGMSVETFKEFQNMKVKNALLQKAEEERVNREQAEQTYKTWLSDSEKVKEIYPSFDMETELSNPTFANLLRNGFSVMDAYQSAHINEIIPQAMQSAVQEAQRKMANSYAANQARPDENASSRSSTATVKRDVASLTDEELDEIDRLSRKRPITLG